MLTLKILCVGRSGEEWLEAGIEMYLTRMRSALKVIEVWVKDDAQLLKAVAHERVLMALDPAGREMSSEQFSLFLQDQFVRGGSQLTCVIGGANGLPKELRERTIPLVSLSQMVLPHHLARLIFVEQVYRALEIAKGTPYHK